MAGVRRAAFCDAWTAFNMGKSCITAVKLPVVQLRLTLFTYRDILSRSYSSTHGLPSSISPSYPRRIECSHQHACHGMHH